MFSKSVFRYCKVSFYPPNIDTVLFYGKHIYRYWYRCPVSRKINMKRTAVYRIGNVNVCIVPCLFLQKISTIHHEISTVNRHTKGYCINLFWMIIFVKLCITYAWMLKGLSDKLTGILFIKLWQQTLLKTILIAKL